MESQDPICTIILEYLEASTHRISVRYISRRADIPAQTVWYHAKHHLEVRIEGRSRGTVIVKDP